MAHSGRDIDCGLKIFDLSNNRLYFEIKNVTVKGIVFSAQTLRVIYFTANDENLLIFDEIDGSIYTISNDPRKFTKGYLLFMNSRTGEIITKSDLTKIK